MHARQRLPSPPLPPLSPPYYLTLLHPLVFHQHFIPLHLSGTSICEQPTPGGTPVRKRGIRNVIAPLREVSWYEEHSLVLLLRHFPFSSRPRARSLSLPLSTNDAHPEEASDRVYYASGLTYFPCPSKQLLLEMLPREYHHDCLISSCMFMDNNNNNN